MLVYVARSAALPLRNEQYRQRIPLHRPTSTHPLVAPRLRLTTEQGSVATAKIFFVMPNGVDQEDEAEEDELQRTTP